MSLDFYILWICKLVVSSVLSASFYILQRYLLGGRHVIRAQTILCEILRWWVKTTFPIYYGTFSWLPKHVLAKRKPIWHFTYTLTNIVMERFMCSTNKTSSPEKQSFIHIRTVPDFGIFSPQKWSKTTFFLQIPTK